MAKKKTPKQRKRQNLKANPNRQAHNQLRGYLYQIWHSVNAWLDLAENEILFLEGAEDFDRISGETATAVQVKDTKHKITLRSQEVNDAINNYWELRANNPDSRVKFRLLTRSKIGTEQGNPFGTGKPGLQVWSRCSGDDTTITKISDFLQNAARISDDVKDFLKNSSPQQIYEKLIEPITWETGSKESSFVEKSISEKLIHHGNRYPIPIPPPDAKKVVDHLLREALMVATQTENRELTKSRFLEIFSEKTSQSVPIAYLQRLQALETQTKILDTGSAKFLGDSTDSPIQSSSPILSKIPPPFPGSYRRSELLANIQAKLQSEGMAVIHGGAGRGKTTLAKFIAKDTSNSWLWLNLTSRKPFQVVHHLQKLAIEISTQSSPVNIVLDDLNLQPQVLREYEEVLGVVVHSVLERGTKLLITSQHEPPNNFILRLGKPQSIVIHVRDFSISEIEQYACQLGCPAEHTKTWARLVQLHTNGHPSLVYARLVRLREGDWKQKDIIESLRQKPPEVVKEQELAQQLLTELPENHQEFLYRLSLIPTEFRKDYALNIGEIPECLPYAGVVFSQLVGPWIDQVTDAYYAISPLLTNAAEQVWSESKTRELRAQIADAILKTRNLTIIETRAVLFNSMVGQNRLGFIAVIQSLRTAPEDSWKELSQEFSWLINGETHIPEKFFPGESFINHLFRSLQHRIAVEVEPEAAPNILESWDKETVPYEPHQLYLQSRLMLATQALRYYQISLPAKRIVGYLKEIIDITDSNSEAREIYYSSYIAAFEEQKTDKSSYFSTLFSFCYCAPNPIYPSFLGDLIDAMDELPPKIRTLLLADFEDDSVDCRLLIDGVWLAELKLENPDWTGCLRVFDKAIEKTFAWGYPHLTAATARGKAIIHDEYLHDPDTAHKVLQDIVSKVGALPVIEEEQGNVYFGQRNYQEALNIYERILPEWNPPSEQVNLGPLEEYRRAAICAAQLNDWERAATIFEDGAKRTQVIEDTERFIGLYADAGFANFKAGNYCDSIKLLNLALREFGRLVEGDNKDTQYSVLKKCLAGTIKWIAEHEDEIKSPERHELPAGLCSDPEPNEKILALPDFQMGYAWLYLAQIEYKFGHDTSVLEEALQTLDRDTYPKLDFSLLIVQTKHDFRNRTFDDLPHRIHKLTNACESMQEEYKSGKQIRERGVDASSIAALANFASNESITALFVSALLIQLSIGVNTREILAIWRTNSSELPKKGSVVGALDLTDTMLSGNQNSALTVLTKQDVKYEERLVAALNIVDCVKTSPERLFRAHTFIATALIDQIWVDTVVTDLAKLMSIQWLEKLKSPAVLQTPRITGPQIEEACKSGETGKKKIGKILLAAREAISLAVASEYLQRFRSWADSESKQQPELKTAKNPIAQRLIRAMEKPPHLTHDDVEALRQSIEEGKIPIKFDTPFEPHQHEKRGEIMEGKSLLTLCVSREEADQKIQEQIAEGQSLHDYPIGTQDSLDQALENHKNWSKDNKDLLLELFYSSSVADEYTRFSDGVSMTSTTSSGSPLDALKEFSIRLSVFREGIGEHVERLVEIRDGIGLYNEPPDTPQRTVGNNEIAEKPTNALGTEVFIVHGHDEAAKHAVARFVKRFDIEPIILDEQPDQGQTIIEKFEDHADETGFAIVLLTPDDVGASKEEANELEPRARQNVILELGYFLGKLGRARVCVLYKEEVQLPSDIHGILYVPMDRSNGWQLKVAQEMKHAGLPVNLNNLA